MSNQASNEQLAGFVQRIESLEAEKAQAAEAIKAEIAQAAAVGFDKKALRQILKRRRADLFATAEHRAIVDTYMASLGALADTELGRWAADWEAAQIKVAKAAVESRLDEIKDIFKSYAEATGRGGRDDLN